MMITDQMIADALPHLRAGARKLSRCEDDANDLLQETFIKAVTYKSNFRFESSLSTWLYSVMRSVCFSRARDMERHTDYVEPWLVGEQIAPTDVEKQVEAIQALSLIDQSVSDPSHRAIFRRVLLGDSSPEIAADLGMCHMTVRTRTLRIRQLLGAAAERTSTQPTRRESKPARSRGGTAPAFAAEQAAA